MMRKASCVAAEVQFDLVQLAPGLSSECHLYTWNPVVKPLGSESKITFIHETHVEVFNCSSIGLNGHRLHATFSDKKNAHTAGYEDLPENLTDALRDRGLLVELSRDDREDPSVAHFAAHSPEPSECLRRLRNSTVGILGLGGTGSVVLQHLIGAGITRLVLADMDTVSASNLNRQFIYSIDDIGRKKTVAAADYVSRRVSEPLITLVEALIASGRDLVEAMRPVDLLFCCIDTPAGKLGEILAEYRHATGSATIQGDVGVQFGSFGPLDVGTEGMRDARQARSGREAAGTPTPWSFGPTNTLVGAMMAKQGIEWLAGIPKSPVERRRKIIRF